MGLDALLRAVAILREDVPDVLLLIGGSGWLRPELEALAAALGLGGHVRFLGFVPEAELAAHYQAADFFVLSTRELEGFGLVAVESLACGTPVLGTPVGAIPEVLEAIGAEYVFDGMEAEAIARGTRKHLARLGDRDGYETLRQVCAETAVARFGWDRVVERLEGELVDLATLPAGRPVR
jgi:glycosyltransferase involved in cell wall biosynthesis